MTYKILGISLITLFISCNSEKKQNVNSNSHQVEVSDKELEFNDNDDINKKIDGITFQLLSQNIYNIKGSLYFEGPGESSGIIYTNSDLLFFESVGNYILIDNDSIQYFNKIDYRESIDSISTDHIFEPLLYKSFVDKYGNGYAIYYDFTTDENLQKTSFFYSLYSKGIRKYGYKELLLNDNETLNILIINQDEGMFVNNSGSYKFIGNGDSLYVSKIDKYNNISNIISKNVIVYQIENDKYVAIDMNYIGKEPNSKIDISVSLYNTIENKEKNNYLEIKISNKKYGSLKMHNQFYSKEKILTIVIVYDCFGYDVEDSNSKDSESCLEYYRYYIDID